MRELSDKRGFADWFLRGIGRMILWCGGWTAVGEPPDVPKYLVIAAPHTSNWDFPIMLGFAFYYHLRVFWMGKDSMFRGLSGKLFLWLGGIPVDRSRPNGMVEDAIDAFQKNEKLIIAILPEGTRKRSDSWRSGFYHIAHGAGVPIAMGFADYAKKRGGFGPLFTTTGDMEADMKVIAEFYAGVKGARPEEQSPVRLRARE